MRVVKTMMFWVGKAIPYSDWPEIVHQFLRERGLSCGKFLYYFENLCSLHLDEEQENKAKKGLDRLYKDLPEIGAPRTREEHRVRKFFISNIDTRGGCTEDQILPLMKKIHRSYGLDESDLYYMDVDFFSETLPSIRNFKYAEDRCRSTGEPLDPLNSLPLQPYGSGFKLYRRITGEACLYCSIEILRNGVVLDPSPYFSALQALLPGARHTERMELYLSDEDRREFIRQTEEAAPALEKCRAWFAARLPESKRQNHFESSYKLAPKLKKLAKQYGFDYRFLAGGLFSLDKKTARGHVFHLIVDSGPSRYDASFSLDFQGLGFQENLGSSTCVPTNQAEFDACAEQVLETAAAFERELLPELDACWPETPDWYLAHF